MTANKRRKTKIAAEMESTGTNYVRAARSVNSGLKDPVNLTWSPGVDQSTGKKLVDSFGGKYSHLRIMSGMSEPRMEHTVQDVVLQLITSNSIKDVQFRIIDRANVYGGESWMEPFKDARHVSHFVASDAHHYNSDATSEDSASRNILRMLKDLNVLAARRANLFSGHPHLPANLKEARLCALQDSQKLGTPLEDHPLYLPYIFLVISDLGVLRSDNQRPTVNTFEHEANRTLKMIHQMAAEFGIYIIAGSSNPMTGRDMKTTSRCIYMKAANRLGSRLLIGDDSLVNIGPREAIVKEWNRTLDSQRITRNSPKSMYEIREALQSSR